MKKWKRFGAGKEDPVWSEVQISCCDRTPDANFYYRKALQPDHTNKHMKHTSISQWCLPPFLEVLLCFGHITMVFFGVTYKYHLYIQMSYFMVKNSFNETQTAFRSSDVEYWALLFRASAGLLFIDVGFVVLGDECILSRFSWNDLTLSRVMLWPRLFAQETQHVK